MNENKFIKEKIAKKCYYKAYIWFALHSQLN